MQPPFSSGTALLRFLFPLIVPSVIGATSARAQSREFRLDAGHSDVEFRIGFLGSTVRGRFDGIRGTILYDERAPASSSITVVIDAASLNSGSRHRDEHLKSADFFDAARYPAIIFQSTSVGRETDGFAITGTLSLHGVTRTVRIPFRAVHPPLADPHGSTIIDFAGSVRLARDDFGISGGSSFNPWFDRLRAATMGDSVDVSLEVVAWDTDFARERSAEVEAALQRIGKEGVSATAARARDLYARNPAALKDQEWAIDRIGRALAQRGQLPDALAIFVLEAELFPQSASAHAALGAGYEAVGRSEDARTEYERALRQDPLETRALARMRRLGQTK
ncbi:MAG: YceI family protein [Gemmatimonadota bacterium]|nr:YceI family protein [Gemmatimonadota bacterium]